MRFLCVGDIALGDHPKTVGHGIYSRYPRGLPKEKIKELFPPGLKADFIFGNLEYDLSEKALIGGSLDDLQCRGVHCYCDFLKSAGFNVLNVANNHIFQQGEEAFVKTLRNLIEHQIAFCGTDKDFTGDLIVQKHGIKVGFIGWSLRPRQHFSKKPLYNEFDESLYEQQILRLKRKVDILITSVHWGDEFIEIPSPYEVEIARRMIEAGANAVMGHHPHVLRKVELYKNGIIAYSLGNFICDMSWEKRTVQTGALYFEIQDNNVIHWRFDPAIICADFFPRYLGDRDAARFLSKFNELTENLQKEAANVGYSHMARKELSKHQIASLIYFLKNIYRYPLKISLEILKSAFRSRLKML